MNIKSLFLWWVFIAGAFCTCSRDDIDVKFLKEEEELAEYILSEFPEAIFLGGGAYMVKTHEEPEGVTVEAGNYILWNWKKTNHITKELEYTSDLSNVNYVESYAKGGPEITVVLSVFPIDEGLKQMRKEEKGDIYVPSRYLIGDFQPRVFSVEIVDVIKDLSVYQETLMSGYIRKLQHRNATVDTIKNVVSTIDMTEYNVMYYIIEQGTGDPVKERANIETKTSISYLIQENKDLEYIVNQDKTWSTYSGEKINTLTKENCVGEILKKMNKGGKVVVTMPSKLLWEDKSLPLNEYGQFYIPKWSVVIFTITIK